jgi:transposase
MDTIEVRVAKRRKRRVWTADEKRMVCAQTRAHGVSVSQVARRYDVNANLVFTWLRDPRFAPGELAEGSPEELGRFLPVEIVEDPGRGDLLPGGESRLEIDLAAGHSLRIIGIYNPEALARLIRGLSS